LLLLQKVTVILNQDLRSRIRADSNFLVTHTALPKPTPFNTIFSTLIKNPFPLRTCYLQEVRQSTPNGGVRPASLALITRKIDIILTITSSQLCIINSVYFYPLHVSTLFLGHVPFVYTFRNQSFLIITPYTLIERGPLLHKQYQISYLSTSLTKLYYTNYSSKCQETTGKYISRKP
jgi:hypothetical protein